jgi:hypothetical protein
VVFEDKEWLNFSYSRLELLMIDMYVLFHVCTYSFMHFLAFFSNIPGPYLFTLRFEFKKVSGTEER